ncbi:MAG: alanine dehydrogenase [Acidobacteriota bacterium]|nr:MAG: alanine dehydrogenase [Acidobacteriota bacterium]
MKIGVPLETTHHEHRVGLTPLGCRRLIDEGHELFVESFAGQDSRFQNEDYIEAGARVVHATDEIYVQTGLVCRVGELTADEVALLPDGCAVCGFMHMAVAPAEVLAALAARKITVIGYEIIEESDGCRPVLTSLSEIAGQLAVHTASHLLTRAAGGRGIVFGGIPGVPAATVVVLGAGTAGRAAARMALAAGAHVIVIDDQLEMLRMTLHDVSRDIVTASASAANLEKFTRVADVLIGAVAIPGARAPFVITEAMVRRMKAGSVVIDLSIDQGGCLETSRPTTLNEPTYDVDGVVHYCVPNMTANVPRTASRAISLAALPYLREIASKGIDEALRSRPALARGVYLYRGQLVNAPAAAALDVVATPLAALLR